MHSARREASVGARATESDAPLALKLFRRVEPDVHPEIEITAHLSRAGFTRVPSIAATVDYARSDGSPSSIGMFTVRRPADGEADGWTHAIDWLGRLFDQVKAIEPPAAALAPPDGGGVPPAPVGDLIGPYLEIAGLLGRRTADMHTALATDTTDPRFAPEPLGRDDLGTAADRALAHAERTLASLEAALGSTPARMSADTASLAQRVLEARRQLLDAIRSIATLETAAPKFRIHGDYRLGQVLLSEGDICIQNVEGHVAWPAAAQREKQSPLKDVASMLRSFSYVAHAAVLTRATATPDQLRHFTGWALSWNAWASTSFLRAYLAQSAATPIGEARDALLQFFMLDRSLRELDGELKNRTEWISIPLNGLVDLLGLR